MFKPKIAKLGLKVFSEPSLAIVEEDNKEVKHHSFGDLDDQTNEFEPIIQNGNFKTFIVKDTVKDEFWTRLKAACFSSTSSS